MAWVREGECNHCGWCCEQTGQMHATVALTSKSDVTYYRVRGFQIHHEEGVPVQARALVDVRLLCPEHEGERCRSYEQRPQTCRDFPSHPAQIQHTPCSYTFKEA